MDVELEPDQPPQVVRAVEALLAEGEPAPDPWWQSGMSDALGDTDPA